MPQHDTAGLDVQILPPTDACRLSLQRAKDGKDTISVPHAERALPHGGLSSGAAGHGQRAP